MKVKSDKVCESWRMEYYNCMEQVLKKAKQTSIALVLNLVRLGQKLCRSYHKHNSSITSSNKKEITDSLPNITIANKDQTQCSALISHIHKNKITITHIIYTVLLAKEDWTSEVDTKATKQADFINNNNNDWPSTELNISEVPDIERSSRSTSGAATILYHIPISSINSWYKDPTMIY